MGGGPLYHKEHLLMLLPFPKPEAILERIEKKHPNIKISYNQIALTDTPRNIEQEIPEDIYQTATILVTLSAVPASPDSCPLLRLIHFISAGTNHIANTPIYTDTTIPLTTSSGIHGPQIAEWVIMTMLCASHRFTLLSDWQRAHHWGKDNDAARRLLSSVRDKSGQRLGILGYGSIGRQVGRVGQAMGMDVIAYTASPRPTPESKKDQGFIVPGTGDPDGTIPIAWFSGLDPSSLHHFLQQDLDHLLISVPLTKHTSHLIGAAEFAILGHRRNAFVSNISRGSILDQEQLIVYLRKYAENDPLDGSGEGAGTGDGGGGLKGAALDVTDPEPLPKESELWNAPNCIVTPHISGLGEAYLDRALQVLEVNLERRERGERMINVVRRERGY